MNLFGWDPDETDKPAQKQDTTTRRMRRKLKRLRGRRRRQERRARRQRESSGGGGGGSASEFAQELLDLHSRARGKSYRLNADLCESAQSKANEMARTGVFRHDRNWDARIDRAGYDARTCGENIGRGFSTARGVMEAWLKSPAHRANIMNGEFTEVGFGEADGYSCAHFGDR